MRFFVWVTCAAGVLAGATMTHGRVVERPTATVLLDRYLQGDYAAVVASLSDESSLDDFLSQLKRDASAWIEADGPAGRHQRELAAATLALEAARAGQWAEWKIRVRVQLPAGPPTVFNYWKAPPLLIEWGCALVRQGHQPKPIERDWFLASVAVAERSEDYEFMVGDTKLDEIAKSPGGYEYNSDVIQHVRHAMLRFPDEPRFNLAQAVAEEYHDRPAARQRFELLQKDVDLRGEATMRLGVMAYWQRDDDRALAQFRKTESLTRDPWVLYLSRYFTGLVQVRRSHPSDAETAFRRALEAVPRAQAATVSLAALMFRDGRRRDASALVSGILTANASPADPWRAYADADDRFWLVLIDRLRLEIRS